MRNKTGRQRRVGQNKPDRDIMRKLKQGRKKNVIQGREKKNIQRKYDNRGQQ